MFDRYRNTNLSKYDLGVVSSAENICKCTLVDLQICNINMKLGARTFTCELRV